MRFEDSDGRQCDICSKLAIDAPGGISHELGWVEVNKINPDGSVTSWDVDTAECYEQLKSKVFPTGV